MSTALVGWSQGLPGAQTESTKPPKRITILPVPVLFYQQETGAGYGLGGLLSGRLGNDTITRSSNIRAQYWTTQKKQNLLQLVHTIYSPGEKYYLNGEISAYTNRLYFFGVGNDAPQVQTSNRSFVDFKLFIINQRIQKSIAKNQFLGLQYRLSRVYNVVPEIGRVDDNGDEIINQTNYFQLDPRVNSQQRNFSVSGVGPVYTYDSRDVALAASKGSLLDLQVMFNGKFIGSDYNFVRYQI
ncbi:MAG: hypothetical protein EOO62_37225, partial [Hymenobacter sp.]